MLSEKQVKEIREHLDNAQNPLFFFDNDQDGLCSFLLLRRFLGRGKGIAVKNTPMGKEYFRRVQEFDSDYIFILDQPAVSQEFFEELEKTNLPVVLIDHHNVGREEIPDFVNYYNSYSDETNSGEPVTHLCYEVVNKKQDLWLSIVGNISDRFVPDYYKDFLKEYSELGINKKEAFEIVYESDIGKISQMLGAGLKDRTTNVMKMIRFLLKVRGPHEILEETSENSFLHKRFSELDFKLNNLVDKAKTKDVEGEKVLFFKYSGDTSMSSDLANKLTYLFPEKVLVIAYLKGEFVNVSMRGEKIKTNVLKIIEKIESVSGGGHENAVGLQMQSKDLDLFVEKLREVF